DLGKLLNLRLGVRHERAVVEWCEEALEVLSGGAAPSIVTPIGEGPREGKA
ncbi:MAG: PadR family transcriptional regulator, partial [Bradyrhizobium icense]